MLGDRKLRQKCYSEGWHPRIQEHTMTIRLENKNGCAREENNWVSSSEAARQPITYNKSRLLFVPINDLSDDNL